MTTMIEDHSHLLDAPTVGDPITSPDDVSPDGWTRPVGACAIHHVSMLAAAGVRWYSATCRVILVDPDDREAAEALGYVVVAEDRVAGVCSLRVPPPPELPPPPR